MPHSEGKRGFLLYRFFIILINHFLHAANKIGAHKMRMNDVLFTPHFKHYATPKTTKVIFEMTIERVEETV
jgi:hypothetical protein